MWLRKQIRFICLAIILCIPFLLGCSPIQTTTTPQIDIKPTNLVRSILLEFGELVPDSNEAKWENELGRWKPLTGIVDGEEKEFQAIKVYVVNSGMMGTGLSISKHYAIDDGLLDGFVLDRVNTETFTAAIDRFLKLDTQKSSKYYRQFREIMIDTDPDQPVWSDGEYLGRTPVNVKVLPGVLPIVVP